MNNSIDVSLNEALSFGKSVFSYAAQSRGLRDYSMLANEVIECTGLNKREGGEK